MATINIFNTLLLKQKSFQFSYIVTFCSVKCLIYFKITYLYNQIFNKVLKHFIVYFSFINKKRKKIAQHRIVVHVIIYFYVNPRITKTTNNKKSRKVDRYYIVNIGDIWLDTYQSMYLPHINVTNYYNCKFILNSSQPSLGILLFLLTKK